MSLALLGLCSPTLRAACPDSAPRRASPTGSARVGRVRFSAQTGALRLACATSPSPSYEEEDEDADEAPWLRELTEQAVVENEQERADEEKALRGRRALSRRLTALVACAYLAAVSALLHFTPALRHVLRATPQQAALGLLALYTAELGWRCHCGVRSSLKVRRLCCATQHTRFTLWRAQALRRCELEVKLHRELGGGASGESQDDPVLIAAHTSQRRAKDFLTALALAAPAELCGAALAAAAPHPAPGIALMCAAQLPLRKCCWMPDEDGIICPVTEQLQNRQLLADGVVVAAAGAAMMAGGAGGAIATAVLAAALLVQVSLLHDLATVNDAAGLQPLTMPPAVPLQ